MFIRQLIGIRERYHPLWRLRQSRFLSRRVLPLFDRRVFIRMHGIGWPVRVRRIRHATYVVDSRLMEPGVVAVIRILSQLSRLKVFWDIGANIGYFSWLTMSADPELRAVLFEPDPDNVMLLRETIALSNLDRATLISKAASADAGVARFVMDPESGTTSHLEDGGVGVKGAVVTVETTTLDAELGRNPAPDLMKIDVEGAEAMVFAGASRVIDEIRPIILLECFDGLESGPIRRLAEAGYTFGNSEDPRREAGATSNYLCLPPECGFTVADIAARFPAEYDRWVPGA